MTYVVDRQAGTVAEGTTWFTAPGWKRAHEFTVWVSMGHEVLYGTECGREYPKALPNWEGPLRAPEGMPRCKHCVRLAGRAA